MFSWWIGLVRVGLFRRLDEFYLVAFGCIDKGKAAATFFHRGAIREFEIVPRKVLAELLKTRHFKGEMGEIGLNVNWAAGGETADFDQLFAAGSLQENQFRSTRRFVSAHFCKAENVRVKSDGTGEVIDAITSVEELGDDLHLRDSSTRTGAGNAASGWISLVSDVP